MGEGGYGSYVGALSMYAFKDRWLESCVRVGSQLSSRPCPGRGAASVV